MSISPTTDQAQGLRSTCRAWRKSYKKLEALRGVDLEVARGSIFACSAQTGAGKS